jgi:hypothetical protein
MITDGIPDKVVNILMDKAKELDDAIESIKNLSAQTREYIVDGLPDKAVEVLMNGAEKLDNAIASARYSRYLMINKIDRTVEDLIFKLDKINELADKIMSGQASDAVKLQFRVLGIELKDYITKTRGNVSSVYNRSLDSLNKVLKNIDELSKGVHIDYLKKVSKDLKDDFNSELKIADLESNLKGRIAKIKSRLDRNQISESTAEAEIDSLKRSPEWLKHNELKNNLAKNILSRMSEYYNFKVSRLDRLVESIARKLALGDELARGKLVADIKNVVNTGDTLLLNQKIQELEAYSADSTLKESVKSDLNYMIDAIDDVENIKKEFIDEIEMQVSTEYEYYIEDLKTISNLLYKNENDRALFEYNFSRDVNDIDKIYDLVQTVYNEINSKLIGKENTVAHGAYQSLFFHLTQYRELLSNAKYKDSIIGLENSILHEQTELGNAQILRERTTKQERLKILDDNITERQKSIERKKVQLAEKLKDPFKDVEWAKFVSPEESERSKLAETITKELVKTEEPKITEKPLPKESPVTTPSKPSRISEGFVLSGVRVSQPFFAVVYENGMFTYKQIDPTEIPSGKIYRLSSLENESFNKRVQDLERTMTHEQAVRLATEEFSETIDETELVTPSKVEPVEITSEKVEIKPIEVTKFVEDIQPLEQTKPEPVPLRAYKTQLDEATNRLKIVRLPPVKLEIENEEEYRRNVPAGTIQWRQGKLWMSIKPREDGSYRDEDLVGSRYPLPGQTKFAVGRGSAKATLQVLGGLPKQDAHVDIGWAIIDISRKNKNMTMKFTGGKEAIERRWAEDTLSRQALEITNPDEVIEMPVANARRTYRPREVKPKDKIEQYMENEVETKPINRQRVPISISRNIEANTKVAGFKPKYYLGRRVRGSGLANSI